MLPLGRRSSRGWWSVPLSWILLVLSPASTSAVSTETRPAPQGFFTFFTEDELDADSLRFRCSSTRVESGQNVSVGQQVPPQTYRVGGERRSHNVDDLLLGFHFDLVSTGPVLSVAPWQRHSATIRAAKVSARRGGQAGACGSSAGLQQCLVAVPQHLLLVLAVAVGLLQLVQEHQVAAQLVEHLNDLFRGHGVEVWRHAPFYIQDPRNALPSQMRVEDAEKCRDGRSLTHSLLHQDLLNGLNLLLAH